MTQSIESMIEVLQAYQAGKRVEARQDDGTWLSLNSVPSWNFRDNEYRIAPKPKKKVKLAAFIDSHGELRWIREELFASDPHNRVPSEDKEIEL